MSSIGVLLVGLSVVSTLYWLSAFTCALRFARRRCAAGGFAPAVSVLKPLCGRHPALEESLRSFCEQDYPDYQVVFGVADPHDPAVEVVRRLADDHPGLDIVLVVSDRVVGPNPKVSNLANAYKSARHDVLVVADSDIRVGRDYLRAVVAPLERPRTGLVTCLYRASAEGGLWRRLGAMFMNDWFLPSAITASALERPAHAFGATMACRREVLDAVGGFEPLAEYLADDFVLGRHVARAGWEVVLSPYVVETAVEPTARALLLRELRWTRTMRAARPVGYFFSAITFGVPLAALALAASRFAPAALVAAAAHVAVRIAGAGLLARALGGRAGVGSALLLPVRDVLSVALWGLAFLGRTVHWRGRRFSVDGAGRLRAEGRRR